jgi:hypothetical protein
LHYDGARKAVRSVIPRGRITDELGDELEDDPEDHGIS